MESGTFGRARATRLNLAAIRRNRGLSLRDIADITKISTPYLQAIEDERFDMLPGLIYSVSYVRQYAKAIDYDAGAILVLLREDKRASDAKLRTHPIEPLCGRRLRWERYWRVLTGVASAAGGQG